MTEFSCSTCQKTFDVAEAVLAKFPGWAPKLCLACKGKNKAVGAAKPPASRGRGYVSREQNLTTAEVLARYTEGPDTGVFTDGAATPNPGSGGWGAVYVVGGKIIAEVAGHAPHTTNNRMELTALIEGYRLVPANTAATVWTDSELCVNSITKWAPGWERNGWRKKGGEIKNLELVRALYDLAKARPDISLKWIRAHSGSRWNEYADALATAYRRDAR